MSRRRCDSCNKFTRLDEIEASEDGLSVDDDGAISGMIVLSALCSHCDEPFATAEVQVECVTTAAECCKAGGDSVEDNWLIESAPFVAEGREVYDAKRRLFVTAEALVSPHAVAIVVDAVNRRADELVERAGDRFELEDIDITLDKLGKGWAVSAEIKVCCGRCSQPLTTVSWSSGSITGDDFE